MNVAEELFDIKPKNNRINSKIKGNKNELNVTHLLQEWTGHEFVRVPMSGGLRWKERGDICGDVINVDREFDFPFSVETKFYKNLGLKITAPYIRTNSIIYRFMQQCKNDAIAAKKKPVLMVRENRMPKDLYYIFFPMILVEHIEWMKHTTAQFMGVNQDIIGFKSDIFFRDISYELFKQIYK